VLNASIQQPCPLAVVLVIQSRVQIPPTGPLSITAILPVLTPRVSVWRNHILAHIPLDNHLAFRLGPVFPVLATIAPVLCDENRRDSIERCPSGRPNRRGVVAGAAIISGHLGTDALLHTIAVAVLLLGEESHIAEIAHLVLVLVGCLATDIYDQLADHPEDVIAEEDATHLAGRRCQRDVLVHRTAVLEREQDECVVIVVLVHHCEFWIVW